MTRGRIICKIFRNVESKYSIFNDYLSFQEMERKYLRVKIEEEIEFQSVRYMELCWWVLGLL